MALHEPDCSHARTLYKWQLWIGHNLDLEHVPQFVWTIPRSEWDDVAIVTISDSTIESQRYGSGGNCLNMFSCSATSGLEYVSILGPAI